MHDEPHAFVLTPPSLRGQVAIITGASRGIGQATAHKLARMGIHLALCARNTQKMTRLAEQLHHEAPDVQVHVMACDVRDAQQVQAVVDETRDRLGRVDILINNAGVAAEISLLQEMSIEAIDRTIDTNLKGAIYFMRAVIPIMVEQQGGSIININSIAGKTAFPYWSVYDASKFGLHAITEAVAEEQRGNRIRIAGIYPGAVDTDIWQGVQLDPLPRREGMLNAGQIADAVAYMLAQPHNVLIREVTVAPLQPAL